MKNLAVGAIGGLGIATAALTASVWTAHMATADSSPLNITASSFIENHGPMKIDGPSPSPNGPRHNMDNMSPGHNMDNMPPGHDMNNMPPGHDMNNMPGMR